MRQYFDPAFMVTNNTHNEHKYRSVELIERGRLGRKGRGERESGVGGRGGADRQTDREGERYLHLLANLDSSVFCSGIHDDKNAYNEHNRICAHRERQAEKEGGRRQ